MVIVINATEAKNRFGEYMKRAYLDQQHLIVERGGIPVVAIVPISDYERIAPRDSTAKLQKKVTSITKEEKARKRLLQTLAYVQNQVHKHAPHVTEEEIEKDIQVAIRAIRR